MREKKLVLFWLSFCRLFSLPVVKVSFCGLTKGIFLKICPLCVHVKINKHSFETFCVWILPERNQSSPNMFCWAGRGWLQRLEIKTFWSKISCWYYTKFKKCTSLCSKVVSASDCRSKGLGFKSSGLSCRISQPWPAPTQSLKCYGPIGKARTTQPSFIHFMNVSLRVLL